MSSLYERMRHATEEMLAVLKLIEEEGHFPAEPPPPSLETVREALARKSEEGFILQVRDLLGKHGASKLTAIDPSHYATLLTEAEALGKKCGG